jgi:dTDP-glucose pyrophosphorylase
MSGVADLALVMPMAGRGSRFSREGWNVPKPLIELGGRPAFWWAVESVRRACAVREMVFVVLAEHVPEFHIDDVIAAHYPHARIVVVAEVTAGAAESAAVGAAAVESTGPIAVNDCDHAFRVQEMSGLVARLAHEVDGALLGFRSTSPAYSYVSLDAHGLVARTVEKSPVGSFAIAGCYLFRDARSFLDAVAAYRAECEYPELYVSGVYNVMIQRGAAIAFQELAIHVPFGTPEELARTDAEQLERLLSEES